QAEAREAFARSRAVAETWLARQADDPEARVLLADAARAEGRSLLDEHRFADARPVLERARKTHDRLGREARAAAPPARSLGGRGERTLERGYGGDQYGRREEPLATLEQATADYETRVRRSPADIDLWLALARCHRDLGQHLANFVDNSDAPRRRHVRRAKAIL